MLEIRGRSASSRLPASPSAGRFARQRTLSRSVAFGGIGLHSGKRVTVLLRPAAPNQGITFRRTDTAGTAAVPALWRDVGDTYLSTVLMDAAGSRIGTVEHLMAAFAGAAIDNVSVELDGPELPAMDGSSEPFMAMLDVAGAIEQPAARRGIRVLEPVVVADGPRRAALLPDDDFSVAVEIDYPGTLIGRQSHHFRMTEGGFATEIAPARTFGFLHEVDSMRAAGLGLGGSLDNAVVIGEHAVLNEGGLRFTDEFVRHKILDAIGDLYLAGGPILGRFEGVQSGHRLNNELLRTLFADPAAWCSVALRVNWSSEFDHRAIASAPA